MEKPNLMIKQKRYSTLEVDRREKDIVMIWMLDKDDAQVVHIERNNLEQVIEILQAEVKAGGVLKT